MKIDASLPTKVVVRDYHEFDQIQDAMKLLNKGIKVKELGWHEGGYAGIIYIGRMTDPDNSQLVKKMEKDIREYENSINPCI